MRHLRTFLVAACTIALTAFPSLPGRGSERAFEPREFSGGLIELVTLAAEGAFSGGAGQLTKSTCQSSGRPSASIDISCDGNTDPDNETPIVVDPADPNHLLAGSNDYHIFVKGSSITARVPTGFFVSFDGGKSWTDGQIPMGSGGSGGNGDPTPAFDAKHGMALMGQLTAGCGQLGPYCGQISVSLSRSRDGGLTWSKPITVAQGSGSLTPSADGIFLDKPWLTVDNDPSSPYYGRAYFAYTRYVLSGGAALESPINLSYSDDGGRTWSVPKEISGSNATYCTFQTAGPASQCDEDEFSTPVVLPGGDVVVHFANYQHEQAWESPGEFESQTMVVRSEDGGRTWGAPIHIADLEDGFGTDLPLNADGRGTQTGFQFRTQTVQGAAVDPVTGDLYAFWTDNRDGQHDVADPVTNTNVFMTTSTNGGLTWTGPTRVTSGAGDRWMAWGDARDGEVRVMFMDSHYFSTAGLYGITLASSHNGGASWSSQRVDSAVSDANQSIWFRAHTADCDACSLFIGDYNGLAIDSLGRTHIVWTDMSRTDSIPAIGRTGAPEDAFYARR